MNPNLALRRLSFALRPHANGMEAARAQVIAIEHRLAHAFPRSRIVPIGSHRRGTAIAVHSPTDILAVLPRSWATWGGRRVAPQMILRRMAEDFRDLALNATVRRDGCAVVFDFKGADHALQVVPGFFRRRSNRYPVYLMPREAHRWMEVSPERYNALFSQADVRLGGRLRVVSRLVKAWGFASLPPFGVSSLYVDTLLATAPIVAKGNSYGECLANLFRELVRRELRGLPDPSGLSGEIVPISSNRSIDHLYAAARGAFELAQEALEAQERGNNVAAKRQWRALFKRRI